MNKHENQIRLLRRQCIWQRAQGTDRDNGYPYRKHVPDCDICRSADLLQLYGDALTDIAGTKTNIDGSGKAWGELGRVVRIARTTVEGE